MSDTSHLCRITSHHMSSHVAVQRILPVSLVTQDITPTVSLCSVAEAAEDHSLSYVASHPISHHKICRVSSGCQFTGSSLLGLSVRGTGTDTNYSLTVGPSTDLPSCRGKGLGNRSQVSLVGLSGRSTGADTNLSLSVGPLSDLTSCRDKGLGHRPQVLLLVLSDLP